MWPKRELNLAEQHVEFPEGRIGQEQYETTATLSSTQNCSFSSPEPLGLILLKTTRPENYGLWGREWELSCQATLLSQALPSEANSSEFNYIAR